jgi:Ca-activated chloride channel family protein
MHLSTWLDCDLVAVEQNDELALLVELTAPSPTTTAPRQPATLQVVLDRSGSMSGDRLEGAKTALLTLIDRWDPTDSFGVVAIDDSVQVAGPTASLERLAATRSPSTSRSRRTVPDEIATAQVSAVPGQQPSTRGCSR